MKSDQPKPTIYGAIDNWKPKSEKLCWLDIIYYTGPTVCKYLQLFVVLCRSFAFWFNFKVWAFSKKTCGSPKVVFCASVREVTCKTPIAESVKLLRRFLKMCWQSEKIFVDDWFKAGIIRASNRVVMSIGYYTEITGGSHTYLIK